jgi:non-ribosomal peptide synthetase component F
VRETTLGAYAHQDLPFEKIVEELKVERVPGYSPLFQVAFSFQSVGGASDSSGDEGESPNSMIQQLEIADRAAKFDLVLHIVSSQDKLAGYFQYNTDLYTSGRIKHMAALFKALLATIGTNAGQGLDRVKEALAAAEKQQRELDLQDAKRARKRLLDATRLKAFGGNS